MLDAALQYDALTSDSELLATAMNWQGDDVRDAPGWFDLVARDHNPAYHFLALLNLVKKYASSRPVVVRGQPETSTRFQEWLTNIYEAESGFQPAKSMDLALGNLDDMKFVFIAPLRNLIHDGLDIKRKVASSISMALCTHDAFFNTIENLRFNICFNNGFMPFGGCNPNEWGNFAQELSIIERIAFGYADGCPVGELDVCCRVDREPAPADAATSWNEEPTGPCNYHNIAARYMTALGIKSITMNDFVMPAQLWRYP